jgi:hypothetical protein
MLQSSSDVLNAIKSGDLSKKGFTVTLTTFREIFTEVQKIHAGTPVVIIVNGNWALAQFSKITNQRIRIKTDKQSVFFWRNYLDKSSFEFASVSAQITGKEKDFHFRVF